MAVMDRNPSQEGNMSVVTVGRFTYNPDTGVVSGPAAYMDERGSARLRRIELGQDAVFNAGLTYSPSPEVALLVSLQTDFAGWKGQKQMESRIGAGTTW